MDVVDGLIPDALSFQSDSIGDPKEEPSLRQLDIAGEPSGSGIIQPGKWLCGNILRKRVKPILGFSPPPAPSFGDKTVDRIGVEILKIHSEVEVR